MGAKRFLVHETSGATLALTPDALNLLRRAWSHRSSDRPHTDMEWQLDRFFAAVASTESAAGQLDVVELNFDAMSGARRTYRLSRDLAEIEPEATH